MRLEAAVDRALGGLLAGLMGLAVVNVTWQVVARYGLASPSSFTDELSRFVLIWIGLLGMARGVGQHLHLAMDFAAQRLHGRRREWLGIAVEAVVAGFAGVVLVGGGGRLVWVTWQLEQQSAALGAPLAAIYVALPLAGVLILFYTTGFVRVRLARLRRAGREVV